MAHDKLRPFLDANVLFSGLYNPNGAPATILEMHVKGKFTVVISRQVLDELIGAMKAKKSDLLSLLQILLTSAPPELAPDPDPATVHRIASLINPADAPILTAALQCGASCLVTGNIRHFTPAVAERSGIQIVTPAQFLSAFGPLPDEDADQ